MFTFKLYAVKNIVIPILLEDDNILLQNYVYYIIQRARELFVSQCWCSQTFCICSLWWGIKIHWNLSPDSHRVFGAEQASSRNNEDCLTENGGKRENFISQHLWMNAYITRWHIRIYTIRVRSALIPMTCCNAFFACVRIAYMCKYVLVISNESESCRWWMAVDCYLLNKRRVCDTNWISQHSVWELS